MLNFVSRSVPETDFARYWNSKQATFLELEASNQQTLPLNRRDGPALKEWFRGLFLSVYTLYGIFISFTFISLTVAHCALFCELVTCFKHDMNLYLLSRSASCLLLESVTLLREGLIIMWLQIYYFSRDNSKSNMTLPRISLLLVAQKQVHERERERLLFVGCLTSQQQTSVSRGRICSDNFTRCHTAIEVADQTFHLTQSKNTDTRPTSPSTDPITPSAWQDSH